MAVQHPKVNPNQYNSDDVMGNSTSTGVAVDMGYNMSYLRITNSTSSIIHVAIGSTAATTDNHQLTTDENLTIQPGGQQMRDIAFARNTTSTELTGVTVLGLG